MGIITKPIDAARKTAEKAEGTLLEWRAKAADTRAAANELEANAGALILADESEAERISIRIQALERTARAYDSAASEAAQKLASAHRAVLQEAQKEEAALADQAQKRLDSHDRAVHSLLSQLTKLDECDYSPARATEGWSAEVGANQVPKSYRLAKVVTKHRTRACVIEYFLKLGKIPAGNYDLNTELGTSFSTLTTSIAEEDGYPPIVYEYRNAGIEFETMG